MLQLRQHLRPLLRAASRPDPVSSPLRRSLLPLSTTSTSSAPFSLEDYLVSACGLAPAEARRASEKAFAEASKQHGRPFEEQRRSRLRSASNPDAVLAVLSSIGLSRADVAAVVAADPLLLRARAKNIGPRLLALRDRLGLSPHQISRFILASSRSRVLRSRDVIPNLEFFMSFYGSFEKLLEATRWRTSILTSRLEGVIKPNIELLRQCGLSVRDIAWLSSVGTRMILTLSPERLKETVQHAEKLGVPHSSRMFKYVVRVIADIGVEKIAARLELFKRILGCSETEVAAAVSKIPHVLGLSEQNILRKTQFLINDVGMKPRHILERARLFTLSLEKRLAPRHHVMKVLQAKGLLKNNMSFYTIAFAGERHFKSKYIDCHRDSVNGLADAYAAACAGDVTPEVQLLRS
ncbi:hypothetical protein ACP4OV_017483 [Aristida adscensionis]